jgi:endonuclease III
MWTVRGICGNAIAVGQSDAAVPKSKGTLNSAKLPNCPLRPPAVNKAKRTTIFERLRAANPAPTTELDYATPFELLIAVILSAQATDKGVNKATASLFPRANTPASILALGEDGLREQIRTLGLFNSKARNIMAACRILVERHHGDVPRRREELEALPGVGRKTANVVLNTAFGEPAMAVDTHIFRVANRTGIAPGKTPLAVERGLIKWVPKPFQRDAHHWLILHGRYVCTARRPRCPSCLVHDLCDYRDKTPSYGIDGA